MRKSKCCGSKILIQEGTKFCTNCISICQNKRDLTLVIFGVLVVLMVFIVNKVKAPNLSYPGIYDFSFTDITLTDEEITKELVKNGCILPNVSICQSKLETGNYTSDICRENRNLFGIKFHKCKYVTGENRSHATYDSYRDNIKCYVKIQNRYLKSMENRYALDSQYINKLKKIK